MSDRPPEAVLWDLLRGALSTKALGVAADLGVADALAGGPRPVAEVAREVGADPEVLHRILRALASDGVFAEEDAGVFRNTETSELLRRGQAGSWREFAHLFGDVFYAASGTLDPRTSESTFARAFDTDYWSWLGRNRDERAAFDRAMAGGKDRHATRLSELEWHTDETVVDIGGGNGALLQALIGRLSEVRGIVFDLPETDRDEASFDDRVSFVAGSFFEQVPEGDTYILSGILHDWGDEAATAILRTIRAAARPNARLLVIDSVVAPGNEPNGAKWLDLLMLVLAGGRERIEAEWRSLLGGAGYAVERIEDGLIEARCR